MLLALYSVAPGHHFKFSPDCVLYGNYGTRLELKRREHRAELVNRQRIVAVHQQIAAPIAYTNHEELDFEIRGGLPLAKHLQDSLLGVFVLQRGALRAFVPTDHVLHSISSIANDLAGRNRSSLLPWRKTLGRKFLVVGQ